MSYLCEAHAKKISVRSRSYLYKCWLEWMGQAGQNYQARLWRSANIYAGNAMEVAYMYFSKATDQEKIAAIKPFSLSSIYLSNILHHANQSYEAHRVLDNAC